MIARKAVTFRIADVRLYIASGVQVYVQHESGGPTARPLPLNGRAGRVFWDKALTSAIIRSAGLPAPDSYKISDGERLHLRHVFAGLSPVAPYGLVVKPNRGLHGKHVYLNITRVEDFAAAIAAAMVAAGAVLVEPMVMGTIYRFFIVNGVVVGVRYGLAETGHSNRHQGARIVAADDAIHVSYKRLAERIVALFDGAFIAGVDMAIPDPTNPARTGPNANCHTIELNGSPGFLGHHFPDEGDPVDVAGAIIDGLLARFGGSGEEAAAPTAARAGSA